ncbi:hypothetical protein L3X38_040610 [Prunus dulcis]|uniref:Uncharacterized protein n=1 Tax=Prunus dulcis TaxID=3755 RepID=A0AAD4YSL5_PRUDU|nr:hypothetical protein L3X38_040610 [Prunus dulcis]
MIFSGLLSLPPAATRAGTGPKMTGQTSPSFPSSSPTLAANDIIEFCRKLAGFGRKIPAARSPFSGYRFHRVRYAFSHIFHDLADQF